MKLHTLYLGNSLNNFNYIVEYGTKKAILIDPFNTRILSDFIRMYDLKPEIVINTHNHYDHTQGNDYFINRYGSKLFVSEVDCNGGNSKPLDDNQIIELEENSYIKIKNSPGHTLGHICSFLYESDELIGIISGDSLFNAGIGNCYSGSPEVSYETIKKVFWNLPGNVKIYPGHNYLRKNLQFDLSIESDNEYASQLLKKSESSYPGEIITDIDLERKINPFLRLNEKSVFEGVCRRLGVPRDWTNAGLDEKQIFLKLRKMRDNF